MLDGKTFKARFIQHKGNSIQLESEGGVKRAFPIDKFSIVDRYYLHKEGVAMEHLEGGEVRNPEVKMKFRSSDFQKVENFHFEGEVEEKKIRGLHRSRVSPHFIFFYEDSVDVEPYMEMMERLWYAHAFRTPGFIEDWGSSRRAYFYIPTGDKLTEIRDYAIAGLPEDTEEHEKDTIWRSWAARYQGTPVLVKKEFKEKYNTMETGWIESFEFSERKVRDELLASYPFFKWQEMFFPGENLPQRKVKTESKLASQKGYLCLIYANEIRLNGSSNQTYSQFYKDGLGIAVPTQGEVKRWGKELATLVENGDVKHSIAKLIYNDRETLTSVDGDRKVHWAQLLMSFGRFMEKDIAHMIYRCELVDYIDTHDAFPDHERLCEIFHYEDEDALDAAFWQFLVKDNALMK